MPTSRFINIPIKKCIIKKKLQPNACLLFWLELIQFFKNIYLCSIFDLIWSTCTGLSTRFFEYSRFNLNVTVFFLLLLLSLIVIVVVECDLNLQFFVLFFWNHDLSWVEFRKKIKITIIIIIEFHRASLKPLLNELICLKHFIFQKKI